VVFMSHLLHHVDNPQKVLNQCYELLIPSGVILIRHGTIEQIRDDVEHTFFPQVPEIDEGRTPTGISVEKWLAKAGFREIYSEEVVQQTYETGKTHLEAARARSTSVLSMISEESYRVGIKRLAEYLEKNPKDEWLLFDKMTLTVGCK
jgi:2-polyprenyl-3-methyl-5-hydroxy-6-metoxy-1,4-benzoquinol methylase